MEYLTLRKKLLLAWCFIIVTACSTTSPQTETYDGLVLVPNTRFGQVFRRPGIDLTAYKTFGLTDCQVSFRKNWLREQNSTSINIRNRVTQQDVDRISERLSALCNETFRNALEQAPPYPLVDSFKVGDKVLVLRPAIVNLDITAPDNLSAGRQRTYTTEAGQMTLLLEALDGTTGDILVRVVDRRRDNNPARMQWTNSVTNQAAAQRILNSWAQQFRKGLDEVTGDAATQ